MSYSSIYDQHSMAFDLRRNEAYAKAIAAVVTPDSVVMDLGAGIGVHALNSARLGARRVYLVEPENTIVVAKQIAEKNGYGHCIQCLQGAIEDLKIPEPVDVIISVFTGNFLLEEDLLPSLFYARDKYLKPGGAMIPQGAFMEAVPVCAPDLYEQEIEVWSKPHMQIDYSAARTFASQSVQYCRSGSELDKAEYLADPARLMSLDFHQAASTHCDATVTFTITKSGLCHGLVGWFQMQLGDVWVSTAPHEPPLHWAAAFLPLDPPIAVEAGEEMTFRLTRPTFGDWTWTVSTTTTQQQRSTFFQHQ